MKKELYLWTINNNKKPHTMNLFTFNTAAPIHHGEFQSTNGITAKADTVCTIYIGKQENADDFITRTRLKEFAQQFGDVLVVMDWAPCGKTIRKAVPVQIVLNGVKGVNAYGGNEVELDGELIKVHDRVESWAEYMSLSV